MMTQQKRPIYSEPTASVYFRVQLPEKILPPAGKWAPEAVKMQRSVDPTGHGLFAIRSVRKGEIIVRFGGRLDPADHIDAYVAKAGKFGHQAHPRWYGCPENADEISRIGAINHSCEPNVGLSDTLVAMQHIIASKEGPVELLITQ
ncbi:SET domain-containing protein-lysine N-methyltransferase [Mesorhizobium onobrychidis]|uniref:SET domain-containing protein n=1 Tax=Mesorhizobium onobrychidis TaxID=2775404 RepID=A0ABY5QWA1_9HYPH|nr:SET domain-containing protein [Mesorhizobium onobrychidis]UVC15368.1 SET domain-containing protein [Mesorhizobium onobrychidis]